MKDKIYSRVLLSIIGMSLSFIGVVIFTMLYMAKDNNYYNIIYKYFNISKDLHSWMMYINIDRIHYKRNEYMHFIHYRKFLHLFTKNVAKVREY